MTSMLATVISSLIMPSQMFLVARISACGMSFCCLAKFARTS